MRAPLLLLSLAIGPLAHAGGVRSATLGETGATTPEISTEELQRILEFGAATVLDARPHLEYSIGHIPGALNVAQKAGQPASAYISDVAEVGRLVKGRKDAPIVLYGNGPFCDKNKRLADELLKEGYTGVRRYQLGIPVWRALGGVTRIDPDGARHVREGDRTAVWIDARPAGSLPRIPGARAIARSRVEVGRDAGELKKAKGDGRLPLNDHNTRIIVFGGTVDEAHFVAQRIAREAFHNVSFFSGSAAELVR